MPSPISVHRQLFIYHSFEIYSQKWSTLNLMDCRKSKSVPNCFFFVDLFGCALGEA